MYQSGELIDLKKTIDGLLAEFDLMVGAYRIGCKRRAYEYHTYKVAELVNNKTARSGR